ncbi:ATP-dependent helicase/nuclease subunit A [Bienertia sinuspersici]
MLWQDEIKVSLRCMHSWFIGVDIGDTSGEKLRLSRVYGWSEIGQKSKIWDLLCGLQERDHITWLIIGDFNEVLYTSEKNVRNPCDFSSVLLFRGVADELNLCEPQTLVYGYTWSKRKHGDKFMGERLEGGQDGSDHFLIILNLFTAVREPPHIAPKSFKLEDKWLHEKEFDEVMCES